MKNLNVPFEDREIKILERAQKKCGNKSWHDTILEWAKENLKEDKNGR